ILLRTAGTFFFLRSCRMGALLFPGTETRLVGRTRPINLISKLGWCRVPGTPPIIPVNNAPPEEGLHPIQQSLHDKDVELIRALVEAYRYVIDLVDDKNTSIRRLRQLLFGGRTEKTDAVVGQCTDRPPATVPLGAATGTESSAREAPPEASGAAAT